MAFLDPAEVSLESALNLLKHDWVYSFFFETSREDHLEQLQHAVSHPCALTGQLSVNTLSNVSPGPHAVSHLDECSDFLFAPSYATATLTVGFDIADRVRTASPLPTPGRFVSRVVRDDSDGVFLAVAEHAELGYTELSYCSQISPGCRSIVFLIVRTEPFMRIVSNLARGYDASAMRKALVYSLFSMDVRRCPSCGSDTLALCDCRLSLRRKTHPLDYEGELSNLVSYVGGFEGFASVRYYQDGVSVFVGNYESRLNTAVTCDANVKQSLSAWAIRDAASSCSLNLVRLGMPSAATAQSSHPAESADATGPVEQIDVGDGFSIGIPAGADQNYSNESAFESSSSVDEVMRLVAEFRNPSGAGTSAGSSGQSADASVVNQTTCTTSLHVDRGSTVESRSREEVLRALNEEATKLKDAKAHPVPRAAQERTSEASNGHVHLKDDNVTVPRSEANDSEDRAVVIEHITTKRAVALAPAPAPLSGIQRPTTFADEVRRKTELRKARNRASALRSNEKKRVQLRKLKDDIAEAAEQETVLREREKQLREENMSLRLAMK